MSEDLYPVVFIKDFDYCPSMLVTIAHRLSDKVISVPRDCYERALAAGAIQPITPEPEVVNAERGETESEPSL